MGFHTLILYVQLEWMSLLQVKVTFLLVLMYVCVIECVGVLCVCVSVYAKPAPKASEGVP